MNKQIYKCCFCENDIDSSKFDVTSLIIITNWEKEKSLQQEQQLFCHIKCLKNQLSQKVPLYITDIE